MEFYPDISSSGQSGIRVADLPGDVLVFRGASFHPDRVSGKLPGGVLDPNARRFHDEAVGNGKRPVPYLYIGSGVSARDQVRSVVDHLNRDVGGWMLDHEAGSGGINQLRAVQAEFEAYGQRCVLTYLPRWYYTGTLGRPPLGGLPPLVNSHYGKGADNSEGWSDFAASDGSRWPVTVLQYTDREAHAGHRIDMNAYRGTRDQLLSLLGGGKRLRRAGAYVYELRATGGT